MKLISHSFPITVSLDEIDELNHVNNINYLQWVQLAANKHWSILSNSNLNTEFVWVVIRHEIDYFSAALLNDELIINTWIGESYGVKSERFVEIKRNDKVLAKAKTIWCLLDKKTMRPVRIPKEIIHILHPEN